MKKMKKSASKLWGARSLLFRGRFLRPRPHFAAFFKLYKIVTLLHRFNLKNSLKICTNFRRMKNEISFSECKMTLFRPDFDENLSEQASPRSRVASAPRPGNTGLGGSGAVVGNSGKPVGCSREPCSNSARTLFGSIVSI